MGKDLIERLRQREWRMTAQRRVVAQVLAGEHVHLTADDVYERALARLPEIGRATVYNTLKELTDLGEVLEVTIDARAKRYDRTRTIHTSTSCASGVASSATCTPRQRPG